MHDDKDGQRIKEWACERCPAKSSSCVEDVETDTAALKSAERKNYMALSSEWCF